MSIVSRIEQIEQHISDDYSILALGGADLTNVDKNILNLKTAWQERLLYFMNNGTDVVWNNWDKVTGEGTTLTLNNTKEAPMKIDLKGNTSQEGTPTPTSPQDIHIVSGDNEINVCSKNLLPRIETTNTQMETGVDFYGITYFISVLPNTQYTLSCGDDTRGYQLREFTSDKEVIKTTGVVFGNAYTTTSTTKYIKFRTNNIVSSFTNTNFQFEKGSKTTYEPYIGNTYPIYLGVENYLPNNATTQTINGITYTINEDKSIKINGTASGRADLWLYGSTTDTGNYVFIPKGTYTISTANFNDGTMFLSFREKTAGVRYLTRQNNGAIELLAQQDCYFYGIMLAVESGKTINNLTFYPQIEKGTKLNSYTPYGTKPIELCKIGTYQDVIKKSTGKNLINFNNLDDVTLRGVTTSYLGSKFKINGTTNEAGNTIAVGNNLNITIPAGTYTLTFAVESGSNTGVGSGKDTAFYLAKANTATMADWLAYIEISRLNTNNKYSVTFTTNEATPLYFYAYTNNSGMVFNNYVIQVQLEKGTQDTSFEPYGIGWYVKKEIGKIVLNGSEAWTYYQEHLILGQSASSINMIPSTNQALCNYYAYTSQGQDKMFTTGNSFSIQVYDSSYTDSTTFKNWLSTHNMVVYYALNTPTYTEITDNTLISQLNALAKSYNSQTNISQESNDLASLLNANALKEME